METIVLEMPFWAYDEIMMCIDMDLQSKYIDDEIKDDLAKALDAIKTIKIKGDEE